MARIRKGDSVMVVSGKGKGRKGKVLRVDVKKNRLIVESVNLLKKHTKPTKTNPKGGIMQKEAPLDLSNVMLICTSCSKPTRPGYRIAKDGTKTRVCRRCEAELGKK
ncbi:hypothetical protein LCGC14_1286790 [marine sediment metagenome]|uniref:KOW domain-containing protein n=1 Tax=marine sediment metagenome TaxID=412755 RepID=A0A0F9NWK8_9ZZZZ|nr:50S ribosomal protein L24 [Actinomycetota bacterium]